MTITTYARGVGSTNSIQDKAGAGAAGAPCRNTGKSCIKGGNHGFTKFQFL